MRVTRVLCHVTGLGVGGGAGKTLFKEFQHWYSQFKQPKKRKHIEKNPPLEEKGNCDNGLSLVIGHGLVQCSL